MGVQGSHGTLNWQRTKKNKILYVGKRKGLKVEFPLRMKVIGKNKNEYGIIGCKGAERVWRG